MAEQTDLATDSLKGRQSRRQRLRERLSSGFSGLSATLSRASGSERTRTLSGSDERPSDSVELAPRELESRENESSNPERKWQNMWESIACEGNDAISLACERWRRSLAGERNTFWSKLAMKVNDSIHSTDSPRKDWDRVSKAVRGGVPASLRCAVWTACSGAMTKKKEAGQNLKLWDEKNHETSDALELSYHFFVKQGLALKNEASGVIEVDVPRTGCEEGLLESVRRVLLAFAAKNPVLGYCQSMNFIAAALLRYCDEESAFWILCSLLEDILPDGYYTRNMVGIRVDMLVLNSLIMRYLPNLHKHFSEHSVDLSPVSMNWFLCLYVNTLPANARDRVLDCLLHEGSKVLKFHPTLI